LSSGSEKTTHSGGKIDRVARNVKILVPLQWEIPPFHNSWKKGKNTNEKKVQF
jgi:hypothetical protein